MGLNLILLPLRGPEKMVEILVLCYDRLSFDQDYEIFGQLTDCGSGKPTIETDPIPPQMWIQTYEDEGIERRREDDRGHKLTFVYAKALKGLKMSESTSPKNKAIKAFVDALPDDIPIVLLWR